MGRLITHVVYFDEGQVQVDTAELEKLGIRCAGRISVAEQEWGAQV